MARIPTASRWFCEIASEGSSHKTPLSVIASDGLAAGFFAEHPSEDGIHVAQVAVQVESMFESFSIEIFCDTRIVCEPFAKTGIRFPRGHGIFLHHFVGVVARHSFFD